MPRHSKAVVYYRAMRPVPFGYKLPPLRAVTVSVIRDDLLIFASDGVRSSFVQEPLLTNPMIRQTADGPQELANHLPVQYAKETDDALVFVARYRGDPS